MKIFIKGTNPCATRRQDLLHYNKFIEESGHEVVESIKDSDTIILWLCGYRTDAIENSLSELKRCQKQYNHKLIIASGCLPDIIKNRLQQEFSGMIIPWKEAETFFEKLFLKESGAFNACSPIFCEAPLCYNARDYRAVNPDKDVIFADQFVKIFLVRGCLHNCTYCTEKLTFPKLKSNEIYPILEEYSKFYNTYNKIMFLGDSVGQYGIEFGYSLVDLIDTFQTNYPNTKYGFQHIHPTDMLKLYSRLERYLEGKKIFHLNIPIQSASDKILHLMNREYTRNDIDKLFNLIINCSFKSYDTHLIIGFPGETEEDFLETVEFMRLYKPRYALISKYCDLEFIPSHKLPNKVNDTIILERIEILSNELNKLGIIHSIDGGDFMEDRFKRINSRGE